MILDKIRKAIPHILALPSDRIWISYDGDADVLHLSFGSSTHSEQIDSTFTRRSAGYRSEDYRLEYPDRPWPESCVASERYHICIFDNGYDTHSEYGEWSIAGAHKEVWDLLGTK